MKEGVNRNYFRYTDEKHLNAGAKALRELGIPVIGTQITVAGSGYKKLLSFFDNVGKKNIRANTEGYFFLQQWKEKKDRDDRYKILRRQREEINRDPKEWLPNVDKEASRLE